MKAMGSASLTHPLAGDLMQHLYQNKNAYGLILLRDSYEKALSESEQMYDKECERKNCPTPKSDRTTQYLLGVKENILSGQVGLHIPPNRPDIEIPAEAIDCTHFDNPLWVDWNFLNGDPKLILGHGPFGFGLQHVEPKEVRKTLEGRHAPQLMKEVRSSTRKYTIEVHNICKSIISDLLKADDKKSYLQNYVDPDQFEEVVADLLREQGLDVFLTPKSRDGGKDIWATVSIEGKRYTVLVECKMRDNKKTLDPALVRAVLGSLVVARKDGINADFAMLVTSTDNIGPESVRIEQLAQELSIKDCNDVLDWAARYGSMKNGLWLPSALDGLLRR